MGFMDVLAAAAASAQAEPQGVLFVLRCEPDPFTKERFNIGVSGVDKAGRRLVKVIDKPGRLECFYGQDAHNVVWLAKAAAEAADMGLSTPSPQVQFDGPRPFFHCTLEQAVERAFAELVTAALPHRDAPSGTKLTDEDAQRQVTDAIKALIGLNFELLANTPNVTLDTERGPWPVMLPLQPVNGVGTIRSADYSPSTLKTHLMDSVLDLECAARYRQKRSAGLFLLRPPDDNLRVQRQIDEVVDSVVHRAPNLVHFEAADTPRALAQRIRVWGEELAAT